MQKKAVLDMKDVGFSIKTVDELVKEFVLRYYPHGISSGNDKRTLYLGLCKLNEDFQRKVSIEGERLQLQQNRDLKFNS